MFLEFGEYILISLAFIINISLYYGNLALSETTLLCLCFICCSLLAYTSTEFSNIYLYRHGKPGIMYSFLLPIIHMSLNFRTTNDNNQTFNFFHIGCILFSFFPAIIELLRYKISADKISSISYIASLSFILIFAYWFVLLLHKLDLLSFIFICFLLCINIFLLMSVPFCLPGSFTFGELVVLCQACCYLLFQLLVTFLSLRVHSSIRSGNQYITDYDMTIFIYVVVSSSALFILILWYVTWFREHWIRFYFLLIVVFFLFTTPILLHWMSQNPLLWLFEFTLQSKHSLLLISLWSLSCMVALLLVFHYNKHADDDDYLLKNSTTRSNNLINFNNINNFNDANENFTSNTANFTTTNNNNSTINENPNNTNFTSNNPNTNNNNSNNPNNNTNNNSNSIISSNDAHLEERRRRQSRVRKLFHLVLIISFLPAFLLNQHLLCLATVLALCVLVLLETMRLLDIPPLGPPMKRHLMVFLDHQDSGFVILTPIYLLIGCSAPLWLSIGRQLSPLLPLVGVISIGVGDTVASLVGTKVGRLHWRGSRKSIEGTTASFIAQLFVASLILLLDSSHHPSFTRVATTILMTSLLEAFTPQIDNLVLPLFMFFALV